MNKSATGHLALALALSFAFSPADAAPSAPSAPLRKPDASDEFFNSGVIPHIRIEISKANFEALRRAEREYVRCTVREGSNVWEEVGIHKKGAAGSDLGLYVLKEGFDKAFLKHHFKNPNGNLYDGGFLHDIDSGLEKTSGTGDVKNQADLKALAAAAKDPDAASRFSRLEKLLDLDRFIDFLALEIMTWHWDGYYMKRNNYRVYHDPDTGKLHFFPHGMDQMFWSPDGPIFPRERDGLVSRALLETPEGKLRYRQHMAGLLTNVFTAEKL